MQLRHQPVVRLAKKMTVESHQRLLDAIRSGDARRAAEEARTHVTAWIRMMPELPASEPAKS
jgi:DNA-binding GntR family transcriptional regulator